MPRLCPHACDECRTRRGSDQSWSPCAHDVDHGGRHECTDHRLTPATAAAAHALDDVRAGGLLRLAGP